MERKESVFKRRRGREVDVVGWMGVDGVALVWGGAGVVLGWCGAGVVGGVVGVRKKEKRW